MLDITNVKVKKNTEKRVQKYPQYKVVEIEGLEDWAELVINPFFDVQGSGAGFNGEIKVAAYFNERTKKADFIQILCHYNSPEFEDEDITMYLCRSDRARLYKAIEKSREQEAA